MIKTNMSFRLNYVVDMDDLYGPIDDVLLGSAVTEEEINNAIESLAESQRSSLNELSSQGELVEKRSSAYAM